MGKEQELLKIGENYESRPDGTLVYKSPILSKDGFEVVRIEETAIANHTPTRTLARPRRHLPQRPRRLPLRQPRLRAPFRRPATQATRLCWLSLCWSAVVRPLEQPLLPARKSTTDN